MRILMYCPLAPKTPKIYARTIMSAFRIAWDEPCEIVFGREDHNDTPQMEEKYDNITDKYNRARELALVGGFDALFTFENDMILPPLTLERLTRLDTDVAYGLYISRHGANPWLAATVLEANYCEWISDDEEQMKKLWGTAVETVGVGMGCTLIHRHVLEAIEFRREPGYRGQDWFFALDLQEHGFRQMHDLGVACGHIQGLPKPQIYWPDPEALGGYRIEFFPQSQMVTSGKDGKLTFHVGGKNSVQVFKASEVDDGVLHTE